MSASAAGARPGHGHELSLGDIGAWTRQCLSSLCQWLESVSEGSVLDMNTRAQNKGEGINPMILIQR